MVARELPFKHRWLPYTVAGMLVVAIAFSRIYLGVHWFSDTLGGASVGLLWITLLGIAYDRHPAPALPFKRLLSVFFVVLLAGSAWELQFRFGQDLARYAPRVETHSVTLAHWRNGYWRELPTYRIDIEGVNTQPLNVQWAGSLTFLRQRLGSRGWQAPPGFGIASVMNWLAPRPDIAKLPILPQVHDGQHQKLLLVKRDEHKKRITVLRLWPANVKITDDASRVWIGTASWLYVNQSLPIISYLKTAADYDSPLGVLRKALATGTAIATVQRHVDTAGLEWHGEVLLAWQTVVAGDTGARQTGQETTPRRE
jgi:hypothetical protein